MSLSKQAELHRDMFLKMLTGTGIKITIHQPPAKTTGSTDSDKVFGSQEEASDYGASTQVLAIVSDTLAGATNFNSVDPYPVGILYESDVVIRVYLPSVLIDPDKPRGKTLLDTAKAIEIDGEFFERIGRVPKTGLPPVGPYIAWAGLRKLE